MSSFWIDCMLIFTPGFAASKAAIVLVQKSLPAPVVEFCQKVIVTLPPLEPPLELEPPLQALSPATPISMAAETATILRTFMR